MGLLELLQQGQTQLSAGSFPGDTPINDPQSGFIQDNSPTHTYYEDETIGQFDNGSKLRYTLDNTALDITNFSSTTGIDAPTYDWITNYPSLVSGKFNGAPNEYDLTYYPNNTYLENVPIQTEDSPQLFTLDNTGLDNTDSTTDETAIIPDSITYPNNYPLLVSGKFDGAPEPYDTPYNPDNTYLDDVPIKDPDSPQIPTLSEINPPTSYGNSTAYPSYATGQWRGASTEFIAPWSYGFQYEGNLFNNLNYVKQQDTLGKTSLDNSNGGSEPTTVPNPNNTWTNYPSLVKGRFNNAPYQFTPPYNIFNLYLDNISIQDNNSPQRYTLDNTGLDNTNSNADETTFTPNSTTAPNNYPEIEGVGLGVLNGAPNNYQSLYNSNNTYLQNVSDNVDTIDTNILGQTGLDNTNNNVANTTLIPNSISYPNNYPTINDVNLGVFNGAPSPYETPYNPSNTYLNLHPIQQESSPQYNTLNRTGLDNTVPDSEFTTTTPGDNTSFPAVEGANLGEWNGAPSQYNSNQAYSSNNTYLNNVSIGDPDSPQIPTLEESGLDNTNPSRVPTTTTPLSITSYPAIPYVSLGKFNGEPSQYQSFYNPNSTYLDIYNAVTNDNTNPLNGNLSSSGLDNTYPFEAAPTANVPSDDTVYPVFSTGQWQGASQLFTQKYGPSTNQYYPPFVETLNTNLLSQQYDSLSKTGLDVDNTNAIPTTDIIVNPDNITVYPASNVTGVTGSNPQSFNQVWKPVKRYYNDYIKPLKDINLA